MSYLGGGRSQKKGKIARETKLSQSGFLALDSLGVHCNGGNEVLLENKLVGTQSSLQIITSFLANYKLGNHLFINLMACYIK